MIENDLGSIVCEMCTGVLGLGAADRHDHFRNSGTSRPDRIRTSSWDHIRRLRI